MTGMLVVIALACGCVHADRVALATSSAMIVCDWGYTRGPAERGWMDWPGQYEENPLLGRQPSTRRVDAYFMSAVALNAAVWSLMPPGYRWIVPVAIVAAQARAISINVGSLGGVCGS